MAGDWIPMRTDLRDDPAVIAIAVELGVEEDLIVGKLHRFWSWANQQTVNGDAPGVTTFWIDEYLRALGIAKLLEKVGWLRVTECGLRIPKFERYNSQSAKRRLLTARRNAALRHRKRDAANVTHASPKEEKRREYISTPPTPSKPKRKLQKRTFFKPPTLDEVQAYCEERQNGIDPQAFLNHYEAVGWIYGNPPKKVKSWKACVRTWEDRRRQEAAQSAAVPSGRRPLPSYGVHEG